ncbi:hypothetical protein ACFYNO_29775 [Kitasatospora sp. NPDC006697]|uniref:hypothetical protein n=1 Tax=Kitasatospora sp. NPDC006697 TaxID=3364020 RepID=UPI0036859DC0
MASDPTSPAPGEPDDELAHLRGRVAELEHGGRRRGPGRPLLALLSALLITLAAVLTPVSVVAAWTRSQLTDTDRYVATVAPLARDPAVQAAITDRVTDQLVQYLPVDSLVNQLAPADRPLINQLLNALGGAATTAISGFVHDQVAKVVASDGFATLWTEVNRNAHTTLDRALTGQGGGAVQVSGNTVTLDLAPVIDQVKQQLVGAGLGVAARIPTVHTQYVLVESPDIGKVRTLLRLLQIAGFWLPVVTVLLAVGGVLAAARRRRAVVTTALAMAAGALLLGIGLDVFRALYLDRLPADVSQPAAGAVYDALVRYLHAGVRLVVVLGLLVALGAWLSGPGRRAGSVRALWRAGIGAVRETAQRIGLRLGPVGRFVHRFKPWLDWGAVLVTVVVLLTWSYPTGLVLIWMAVVLLVVLAVVEFLDEPGSSGGADEVSALTGTGDTG